MSKTIEEYIQFAIDNGFDFHKFISNKENFYKWTKDFEIKFNKRNITLTSGGLILYRQNIIELITSKPFIEAVARGYEKTFKWDKKEEYYYKGTLKNKTKTWLCFEEMIDYITIEQAITIRDNKLEEFINNLLPNE